MVKLGLCGFTMSAAEYFRTFRVVEVQQTFYQPPEARTLERWRVTAPAGFEFTMKAWQLITHRATSRTYRRLRTPLSAAQKEEAGAFQLTPTVLDAWQTSLRCARLLHATAILFQCPASFRPTDGHVANMRRFFAAIERPKGVTLMWEPRGEWPDELVRGLCQELDLIHAVDPFVGPSLTPRLTYWRLHGNTGARHVYTDAELRQLIAWLPSAGEAYVMFNNMPRIADAARFQEMMRR
ncbi:MAG TPA: DUF72 domain-containing protein [Thermoanaerobaculia bacterium]|jgi:uncharacterized protein YecE (DUF72 family)|nr:DUF72 domain-containing protein [Thermoanaerobaculia bacterium]